MQSSRIYSDFSTEIAWIRQEVSRDVQSLNPSIRPLARFYTEERLKVLRSRNNAGVAEQRTATPIPYLAFWFADALGLADTRLRRLSGYSLACSSIAATLRDDIADSGPANRSGKLRLASFWDRRGTLALREVFSSERELRRAVSRADSEWSKFSRWHSLPLTGPVRRPFSADFLREASRYYVACSLPSLLAISYAAGRKEEEHHVERFLTEFAKGWRIVDDLADWEADLHVKDLNRSTILLYVQNGTGDEGNLDRTDVLSWLLNGEFVEYVYGIMIVSFRNARRAVACYGNSYIDRYLEEQIAFEAERRDLVLRSASLGLSDLNGGLVSVLGLRVRPGSLRRMNQL